MRGVRGTLLLALAALTATTSLLGGCTIPKGKAENESSLFVADAYGETRVPARAERVVTLSPDSTDDALALGLRPKAVATFPDGHLPTYLASRLRGIEKAGTYDKPFLNAVNFVGPDLILGEKDLQKRYHGRLKRIAATIFSDDLGNSFEVNTRLFGEAMGRTDQAEALLSKYDRIALRSRRRLHHLGDFKVSVVRVLPGGKLQAAGARSFAGVVLGEAGLGRPRSQQVEKDFVKVKGIASLDGDAIILTVAPGAERAAAKLEQSAAWKRLRAVRKGQVHRMPDDPWRTGGGVLGAELAQRQLLKALSSAR
jgi:iron complex transport system substrate-binding protein